MRIVLTTGNYVHVPDGVSLTLNRLVGFLQRKGHEVLVLAPVIADPPIRHAGTLRKVPSFPMPGRPEYRISLPFGPDLYEEVRRFNPDLVHVATPDFPGLQMILWAKQHGRPVAASYHTHFASYMDYYRLGWTVPMVWAIQRWIYGAADAVFVPSESMAAYLQGYGIDRNVRIWARGVDLDLFHPGKRDLAWRRSIGVQDGDVLVSFVSRLVWEKDLDSVIKTFRNLHAADGRIRTLVVGEGPELLPTRNALPQTHFAGYLKGEELARAYASSDVFLFPSTTETFGNVTLEALASGLPSVVAHATGNRSLVRDGWNGSLVTPRDVPEFTRVILDLIHNPGRRRTLSENARSFAAGFDWDAINQGLLDDYQRLLSE
jgi:phosphatidylinositol alpha 1,6-mannosyltransferase